MRPEPEGVAPMSDLALLAQLPEVTSVVRGSLAGVFLDGVEAADGETVAAVMGFVASSLLRAGEDLGLGALRRISVAGEAAACVVVVRADDVIAMRVDPPRAVVTVEKHLDNSLQGRG